MTEDVFWGRGKGEWLITDRKINDNIRLALKYHVPFFGALHIFRSRLILLKMLGNEGVRTTSGNVHLSETQFDITGDRHVKRPNLYEPMHDAIFIRY